MSVKTCSNLEEWLKEWHLPLPVKTLIRLWWGKLIDAIHSEIKASEDKQQITPEGLKLLDRIEEIFRVNYAVNSELGHSLQATLQKTISEIVIEARENKTTNS